MAGPHLQALNWDRPADETDLLYATDDPARILPHLHDPERRPGEPRVFFGLIGSDNTLQKSANERERLRREHRVKALEMESAGVAEASWMGEVGYLVVRGVCDYADAAKNDLWHHYAAAAAAAYVGALLEQMPAGQGSSHTARHAHEDVLAQPGAAGAIPSSLLETGLGSGAVLPTVPLKRDS